MAAKREREQTFDRALTLAALAAVSTYEYGLRVLLLLAVSACVCMLTELICLYIRRIHFHLRHLEAAVSGMILVMLLPATVPLPLLIMSAIFAIIIGRQVFGGGEQPLFPSAAVGYCFARLNAPEAVLRYPVQKGALALLSPEAALGSGVSGAWNRSGVLPGSTEDWLIGLPEQPLGTGSLLLLGVIALMLCIRRSASGWLLFPMLAALISGSMMLGWFRAPLHDAAGCCLTNQTLFAAVYLLADPFCAPRGPAAAVYGLACAALIIMLTRFLPVTDAPVMLSVLMSPLAAFLRVQPISGGKGDAHKDGREGELSAAPEPDPA